MMWSRDLTHSLMLTGQVLYLLRHITIWFHSFRWWWGIQWSILTGKFCEIQISLSRTVFLEYSHIHSCPCGMEGFCALYQQSLIFTRDSSWNSKYWLCPFPRFFDPSSWYSSPRSTLTGLTVPRCLLLEPSWLTTGNPSRKCYFGGHLSLQYEDCNGWGVLCDMST